jgi:hypothetical protein
MIPGAGCPLQLSLQAISFQNQSRNIITPVLTDELYLRRETAEITGFIGTELVKTIALNNLL